MMDAAGIVLHPTLVAFTPWTTLDDYIATVELFRAHGLVAYVPPVQLAIRLLVPPHSALLADPDAASWVGPLDREAFTPSLDASRSAHGRAVRGGSRRGWRRRRTRARIRAQTWDAVRALAYAAAGRAAARRSHAAGVPARPAAAHRALVLLSGATARSG